MIARRIERTRVIADSPPTAGDQGVTFTVSDAASGSAQQTFTISVALVCTAGGVSSRAVAVIDRARAHWLPAYAVPKQLPVSPDSYPADAPFAAMGSTPPLSSMSSQKWQDTK